MLKKWICALTALCLMLTALPALAAVHVDVQPPEDWEQRDLLRITVFRTGEGDCMLVQQGGESMMIDGGPEKYHQKLYDALTQREITHMKYLFSTHPHDDHIEGLRMLMRHGMEADVFLTAFGPNTNGYQQKALKQAEASGIPVKQISSGEILTLGEAVLTVLRYEGSANVNAQSAVLRLEYAECSALLCADIIGESQHWFLDSLAPETLKADVVKAPHHGLTAFVSGFLTAVDPEFIWVTNYKNDKVKKMRDQAQYRKLPIKYSGNGTVYLECDGTDWYIYQTLGKF